LRAVNTSRSSYDRPRWVIPPDAMAEFERRRAGGPLPKPRKRKRQQGFVDYYPDQESN
jgi:hypothetical protein